MHILYDDALSKSDPNDPTTRQQKLKSGDQKINKKRFATQLTLVTRTNSISYIPQIDPKEERRETLERR